MMDNVSERLMFVRGKPYTMSADPGKKVYGERLIQSDGAEYREWSPNRSKLSAYLCLNGKHFPFTEESNVLYLGAASGTTASHISDVAVSGKIYCVEFSQRTFRDLVANCGNRKNMIPILGDATKPETYRFAVDNVDIVYQDVAQKGQADILADNMEHFSSKYGMVSVKARSEDVTAPPNVIFERSCERLKERGMKILDVRSLEPYENSHSMIVVEMIS